ncbi:MAG: hypothetical protein ACO3C4_03470 [Candidatus Limnocylindrus sp.]
MWTRRFRPKNETIFTGAIVASALVLALRGWLLFRSGDNILAYAADPGAAASGILGEQLALAVLRLLAVILDVAAGLAILGWLGRLHREGLLSDRERRIAIVIGALPWTPLLLAQSVANPPVSVLVFLGHAVWVAIAAMILRRARAAKLIDSGPYAHGGLVATVLLASWTLGGAAAPWVYAQPVPAIQEALDASVQAQLLDVVREQRVRGVIMILGGAFTMAAVLPLMAAVRTATGELDERLQRLREEG